MPDKAYLAQNNVPDRYVITSVPVIPQEDHYCGPAALATVAQYNGHDLSQQEAAQMVYTPGSQGTFQHDIVTALQRKGMLAIPVDSTNNLIQEIAAEHPVIIFQNLGLSWYPLWHYSVIAGYDLSEGTLLVHGGTDKKKWKALSKVGRTWKRTGYWGYIGVPAGTLPPTATEEELLQAIAGLELAGFPNKAKQSYEAILRTYPQSYGALFGLGNVAMTKKKFETAENYYRKALNINPLHLHSINNLAYSLKAQGKEQEGCRLLREHLPEQSQEANRELRDSYAELCV